MTGFLEIDSGGVLRGNGQVTGIEISPASATVGNGATQSFTASVTITGFPIRDISWSLSGSNTSAGTAIQSSNASTGLLTVGADETASSLTVTAASVSDPGKTASATVTLHDGRLHGTGNRVYSWNKPSLSKVTALHGITYGNGVFIALGNTYMAKSTDNGANWTVDTPGIPRNWNLRSPAYGEYLAGETPSPTFVALGYNTSTYKYGILYSVNDGANWTLADLPSAIGSNYASVSTPVFLNNTFIALTSVNNNLLISSTDGGVTWGFLSPVGGVFSSFSKSSSLCAGGKFFVFTNSSGQIAVNQSSDGINYDSYYVSTSVTSPVPVLGNNEILLLGGSEGKILRASLNDIDSPGDWTEEAFPYSGIQFQAGAYGDGVYLLVTNAAAGAPRFLYSNDNRATWLGLSESALNFSSSVLFQRLIFVDGDFYGVAGNGSLVHTTHAAE
jgi:hypothetical protein